jgi:DeoR/GlpR family transcriptional regulator of sugar metabolism
MIVQERHSAIMRVLRRRRRLPYARLQRELGVSRSTLRRDLLELEHLGEIVRRRGLVLHADYLKGEPSFDRRRARRVEEKQAIARVAAELVPANSSVYIDAGTTCLELAKVLLTRRDLKIFTHSIRILSGAVSSDASIFCVGGEYRPVSDAVVGGLAAAWLDQLHFDICFVAASGLSAEGLFTTELTETVIKQQILRRSDRRLLVADSEKWDAPAAVRFDDWSRITDFISDSQLSPAARRTVRSQSVQLHLS